MTAPTFREWRMKLARRIAPGPIMYDPFPGDGAIVIYRSKLREALGEMKSAIRTDPTDRFWEGYDAAIVSVEVAIWPMGRPPRAAEPPGLDLDALARALERNDREYKQGGWWLVGPNGWGKLAEDIAREYRAILAETDEPDPDWRHR